MLFVGSPRLAAPTLPDLGTPPLPHENTSHPHGGMIEDFPRVSADELRYIGLFNRADHERPLVVNIGAEQFLFTYSASKSCIVAKYAFEKQAESQVFGVSLIDLNLGKRAYFIDPVTNKSVLHLYLVGTRLLTNRQCGAAYGSRGGKGRRTISRQRRLVARLTGGDRLTGRL
jgi:hypothetical protein